MTTEKLTGEAGRQTKILMLGTGHAMVTKCFNTCFLIRTGEGSVLTDCGGGNGLLRQMELAGADWRKVRTIFLTHAHTDHLSGAVWALRRMNRILEGDMTLDVYGHGESIHLLEEMCRVMLGNEGRPYDYAGGRVQLHVLGDGDGFKACGMDFTAFDIGSSDKLQYGFRCEYEPGKMLVCLGDESYRDRSEAYVRGADWLMHEAIRAEDAPEGQGHSRHGSAAAAAATAARLGVRNLLLYHGHDRDLAHRKEEFTAAAAAAFAGRIEVPDDLEEICLEEK